MLCFSTDTGDKVFSQARRGEQQLIEFLRTRVAGEQVKQFGEILAKAFTACK